MWSLVQVEHLVVYALHLVGFLLYGPVWKPTSVVRHRTIEQASRRWRRRDDFHDGPQNYVLSRLRRRLRHKRHVKIAMTWFEGPYRTAVRRVQRYWQMRKRAYLLERIEQQKDAFEAPEGVLIAASCGLSEIIRHRREPDEAVGGLFFYFEAFRGEIARTRYQAARKHLDDLDAAATMKRRFEERHDRAEVKASRRSNRGNLTVLCGRSERWTAASAARSPNL